MCEVPWARACSLSTVGAGWYAGRTCVLPGIPRVVCTLRLHLGAPRPFAEWWACTVFHVPRRHAGCTCVAWRCGWSLQQAGLAGVLCRMDVAPFPGPATPHDDLGGLVFWRSCFLGRFPGFLGAPVSRFVPVPVIRHVHSASQLYAFRRRSLQVWRG